jgi:hypothetical protein
MVINYFKVMLLIVCLFQLRNQAQGELKALRADLTQKKINMTLIRTSHAQQPLSHTPAPMLTPRS